MNQTSQHYMREEIDSERMRLLPFLCCKAVCPIQSDIKTGMSCNTADKIACYLKSYTILETAKLLSRY